MAQTDIFPKSDKGKLGAGVLAAGAVAVGQSPGGGAQSVLKVATDSSLTGWPLALPCIKVKQLVVLSCAIKFPVILIMMSDAS